MPVWVRGLARTGVRGAVFVAVAAVAGADGCGEPGRSMQMPLTAVWQVGYCTWDGVRLAAKAPGWDRR